MLSHLLPRISKHTCYCEPFAGGLAVLLAKERSTVEVLNDIDGDLVNFYRCVRHHPEALIRELRYFLNSREEFFDYVAQPGLTDLQRAARWFHRNKTCFGGADMRSFGTSAMSPPSSRSGRIENIRALSRRLDRALIEKLDWQKCLEKYDRPTTFFFVDPPYTECGRTAYDGWQDADVQTLRRALDALQGRWMVTLNDSPAIREIFAGCQIEPIARAKGINARAADKVYHELVITPAE